MTAMRILYVESCPLTRWAIEATLADAGHEVVCAASDDEAQTALDRHDLDALVTDVGPAGVINGARLVDAWLLRHPGKPVILLTGAHPSDPGLRRLLRYAQFLPKPVSPETLVAVVAGLARPALVPA